MDSFSFEVVLQKLYYIMKCMIPLLNSYTTNSDRWNTWNEYAVLFTWTVFVWLLYNKNVCMLATLSNKNILNQSKHNLSLFGK